VGNVASDTADKDGRRLEVAFKSGFFARLHIKDCDFENRRLWSGSEN
jgi:hypothetical protein